LGRTDERIAQVAGTPQLGRRGNGERLRQQVLVAEVTRRCHLNPLRGYKIHRTGGNRETDENEAEYVVELNTPTSVEWRRLRDGRLQNARDPFILERCLVHPDLDRTLPGEHCQGIFERGPGVFDAGEVDFSGQCRAHFLHPLALRRSEDEGFWQFVL
jgi:hypothetical protein